MSEQLPDWTCGEDGRADTSPRFVALCREVERLIRGCAHDLIAGRADRTAGLIMAQLAHKHGLVPASRLPRTVCCDRQDVIEITPMSSSDRVWLCNNCRAEIREPGTRGGIVTDPRPFGDLTDPPEVFFPSSTVEAAE